MDEQEGKEEGEKEEGEATAAAAAGHKAKNIHHLDFCRKNLVSPGLDREVPEGRGPLLQVWLLAVII